MAWDFHGKKKRTEYLQSFFMEILPVAFATLKVHFRRSVENVGIYQEKYG